MASNKNYLDTHTSTDQDMLNKLEAALGNYDKLQRKSVDEFFDYQKDKYNELARFKVDALIKENKKKKDIEITAEKVLFQLKQKEIKKITAKEQKKNGGKALTDERKKQISKEVEAEFKLKKNLLTKLEKAAEKQQKQKEKEERNDLLKSEQESLTNALTSKGLTLSERTKALKNSFLEHDKDGNVTGVNVLKGLTELVGSIADLAKELDGTVEDIASSKTAIDTRLQGSKNARKGTSYWDQINSDITESIGASPWVKQSDVVSNLKTMVNAGISFNVEQRAFLETIKTSIADTFNANDATLKKLVRIQQADSTAARLGMESALTAFLNNMYETTEYMTEAAEGIRQNIYEASALMTAKSATEFEYQVQKWMGSLYSVGFSNTSGLSSALGNLAAGNISSISDGGMGNLLVMAANKANMSVADILADGLDSSETNQLMQAMVNYLGEIYSETKGSNILAQQYASVFGLTASDLKAAANLASSTSNIANNNLNYGGMLTQLNNMANTIYQRTSLGQQLSNIWDNTKYSIAGGIANNPAAYATWKIASLLDSVAGGINLPIYTFGGSLNTNFNVSDILQTGLLGYSLLDNIGSLINGLGTSGSGLLSKFGITGNTTVTRGTGTGLLTTSGATTSESGFIGNSEGGDVYNKTMTDTVDSTNQQISAAEEESTDATKTDINNSIIQIYDLFSSIISNNGIKVDCGDTAVWSRGGGF